MSSLFQVFCFNGKNLMQGTCGETTQNIHEEFMLARLNLLFL